MHACTPSAARMHVAGAAAAAVAAATATATAADTLADVACYMFVTSLRWMGN